MIKKMKVQIFNKKFFSSSFYLISSWQWPSCHQQNPKTISSKSFITFNNSKNVKQPEPPSRSFSSTTTTEHFMENPPEIENVIRGLKSSERLIFQRIGESKSILKEATNRKEENFMLLSLESNDPYSDFKKSMEKMIEAETLQHDWRSLEKLLFWFLKVNVKTSRKYIFAAFFDLLLNLSISKEAAMFLPGNLIGEKRRNVDTLFEMDQKIY